MNLKGYRVGPALIVWAVTLFVIVVLVAVPSGEVVQAKSGAMQECGSVLAALNDGDTCIGEQMRSLGISVLVMFTGLALGTLVLVSRHRTHWSED